MNKRTTWAVVTAAMGISWAVAVALLVVIFTDWSTDTQVLVAGAIAGAGVAVILALRMKRLPASPTP